ncbi:hypothetical protein BJ741DRAFT_185179 [Chytriomyces cf. hyalinus JEL632]|nr:hypothetical protein BJ741DRAFT_185179 [Chytriomyces cf. hyalinus JEL632]
MDGRHTFFLTKKSSQNCRQLRHHSPKTATTMDSSSHVTSNPCTTKPILKRPFQTPALTIGNRHAADALTHSQDSFSTSPTGWMDNGVMAMVRQRRVSFSAELLNDEGRHVPHTEAEAERQRGKGQGSAAQNMSPPQGLFYSETNDSFNALEDYQSGCESDDEADEDSLSGALNGGPLFRVVSYYSLYSCLAARDTSCLGETGFTRGWMDLHSPAQKYLTKNN